MHKFMVNSKNILFKAFLALLVQYVFKLQPFFEKIFIQTFQPNFSLVQYFYTLPFTVYSLNHRSILNVS